jgi:hypothetical protein
MGFSVAPKGADPLPRGEQLLKNLLIIIFKLGNCTNPRADYEIQLVGVGLI